MFMELSFGQYAALGPVAVYRRFCPLFRGLGYGMVIVSAIVMLYYNLIIGWTIFYMFASLSSELPWQHCNDKWATQCKFGGTVSLLFCFKGYMIPVLYEQLSLLFVFPRLFFIRRSGSV